MIKRKLLLVVTLLALFSWSTSVSAQDNMSAIKPLPIDTAIRVGQLPNGLTYYVRHNAYPEKRADFYIAQRVGSILEKDEQSGLAHFLEHMAFNGTKNFPEKSLIHYLESIGVRFGSNLNAYTGFDETVYTIMNAPTTRQGIVDSCLLILHDWSNSISLKGKEIDNERGVIQEEWRSRDNASLRNFTNILKDALPGNKYAERMPIGSMDVVMNFKHDALRDYYHKWYRPDLQALIIVGDIDPDHVVAQLHKIFTDVPKPVNPAERVYTKVEMDNGPLVGVATDPEATSTNVMITYKMETLPDSLKSTLVGLSFDYIKSMISQMFSARFAEIAKQPNAPFFGANVSFGPYMGLTKTMDAITFETSTREGRLEEGIKALMTEIVRVRDHGFTDGESDRARKNFGAAIDQMYNERDKRTNGQLAQQCVDAFTNGATLCDIKTYHMYMSNFAQNFRLDAVNMAVANMLGVDKDNSDGQSNINPRYEFDKRIKESGIFITGPKKGGVTYPTSEELKALYLQYSNMDVDPYKDEANNQPLMDEIPTKGSIVKEVKDGKYGTTVWTLSNGAEVVFKVTDYMDDQISMKGQKTGGLGSLDAADVANAKVFNEVINLGGLGTFDDTALGKVLSGRVAAISPSVSYQNTTIGGSANKEGLETMMQLLYLNFTAKRSDEKAYDVYRQNKIEGLKMAASNPLSTIPDSLMAIAYPHNQFLAPFKAAEFAQVSYPRIMALYHSFFKSASGFKFFFVGNIDEVKLRDYVETYIASLPGDPSEKVAERPAMPAFRTGDHVSHFSKKLNNPMAIVINVFSGKIPYTRENLLRLYILSEVMDQVYTASIREDEGGTYGVDVNGELKRQPEGETILSITFQTSPEKAMYLNSIAVRELRKVAKEGPDRIHFDKVIKNMLKQHSESIKTNGYWMGQIVNYYIHGNDFSSDYEKVLMSITPDSVADLARQLLAQNNYINMIVYTEGHNLTPAK